MNILVDTEVLLLTQTGDSKLSQKVRDLILSNADYKWISHASIFEITIKHKIGKLPQIGLSLRGFVEQIERDGFRLLPLSTEHFLAYDQLPLFEDHRDPFDRLILATALHERWPIMASDRKFTWYSNLIEVIW